MLQLGMCVIGDKLIREKLQKMTMFGDTKINIHVALNVVNDLGIQGECYFCHFTVLNQ